MKLQHLKPPKPTCGSCLHFDSKDRFCIERLGRTFKKCSGCRLYVPLLSVLEDDK